MKQRAPLTAEAVPWVALTPARLLCGSQGEESSNDGMQGRRFPHPRYDCVPELEVLHYVLDA